MRSLRFVQIGDLHLGPGRRNADRRAALDYVIDREQASGLALWLLPGDLNHAGMTIDDRNFLVSRILRMAESAPVLIVPGNHDYSGELNFLGHLRTRFSVDVVTTPGVRQQQLATGGEATVFCLPYPSKAMLVAAGTPHGDLTADAARAFDAMFMYGAEQLQLSRAAGLPTLAIGHVNIRGSVASTGQPQIGQELEIDATHLARLGDCFKGFNHIHKHQELHGTWYAGSLCRLDWGETEPKGYLSVTLTSQPVPMQGRAPRTHWAHSVEFVPVPVAPMYHVEGLLVRSASQTTADATFKWEVRKGPDGPKDHAPICRACAVADRLTGVGRVDVQVGDEQGVLVIGEPRDCDVCGNTHVDWTGCDVRVRVRYEQAERDVLLPHVADVKAMFPGARTVDVEPIAVTRRELRAPEVVQATTLEDKLAAWARLSGVSWAGRIVECASALLAEDAGDALLRETAERMERLVPQQEATQ